MDKKEMTDEEYDLLVIPYADALANLMTRLEVLNNDYRLKYQNYPIHMIQKRIKAKDSIEKKLGKKGRRICADEAKESLLDIAGARIICYFVEDIYSVVELVKRQSDILVLKERDYIKNAKKNGYRSFHLIIGIPVYHTDGMEYYPVEIQLRTMAMDLWASMEHRICYKNDENVKENIEVFQQFARDLTAMEEVLNRIKPKRKRIQLE